LFKRCFHNIIEYTMLHSGQFGTYFRILFILLYVVKQMTPSKVPPSRAGSRPHLIHGFLGPRESAPKRHLDRFSRFCTAHLCAQHTDRQTDTQTTLRATSVPISYIYAPCVQTMRPIMLVEIMASPKYTVEFSGLTFF